MAKLIKSILANRMMFRGGGLVPPSQAAGILASSSPLIDSVTMNEGGPVNFQTGGLAMGTPPQALGGTIAEFSQRSAENAKQRRAQLSQLIQQAFAAGAKTFEQVVTHVASVTGESLDNAASLVQEVTDVAAGTAKEAWRRGLDAQDALWSGDVLPGPGEETFTLGESGSAQANALDFPGGEVALEIGATQPPSQEALQARYDYVADPIAYAGEDPGRAATLHSGETIVPGELLRQATGWSEGLGQHQHPYDAALQAVGRPTTTDMATQIRGEAMKLGDEAAANLIRQTGLPPFAQDPTGIKEPVRRYYPDPTVAENVQDFVTGDEQISWGSDSQPFIGAGRHAVGRDPADRFTGKTTSERIEDAMLPPQLAPGPVVIDPNAYMDLEDRFTEEDEAEAAVASSAFEDERASHIASRVKKKIIAGLSDDQSNLTEQAETNLKKLKNEAEDEDSGQQGVRPKLISSEKVVTEGILTTAKDDDPEDLKDWLKTFKEEFIETAPEYEGASDFEKSMAWVKTGLAIAAGTSPFAIKNIADGFLATIDDHTEGAKEKREYERQIKLSAAEYALAANNKRREDTRALELEGKKPIEVMPVRDITDEDGNVLYKKGKIAYVPYSTVQGNPELFGGELAIQAAIDTRVKNATAFTEVIEAAIKQAGGNTAEKVRQYATAAKDYNEAAQNVQKQLNMFGLISSSLDIAEDYTITGFKGHVAKLLNQGANFLNLELRRKDEDAGNSLGSRMAGATDEQLAEAAIKAGEHEEQHWRNADERLNDYKEQRSLWAWFEENVRTGENIAMYEMQQQRLANLLIRELLGEGSKNISNIDRDLAQQIVGLYEDYLFADPEVLKERLMAIELGIRKSYTNSVTKMNQFEDQWGAYSVGPIKTDEAGFPLPRPTVQEVVVNPTRENILAFAAQEGQFGTSVPVEHLTRIQEILDATGTYKLNDKGVYVLTKG